ncbi:hypothetical protein N7478_005012 [Penicillium angulare]|uniref:uncharacterized protein n=1 Tax=Penicillium angulare TaxID=116970 RepID=UPI002540C679|nr:uncharacterized protein N7478_005012 [Penicillium angulare]KAJ5279640.1 hypothetical protein N7478_005012 [Penicillium angulare]
MKNGRDRSIGYGDFREPHIQIPNHSSFTDKEHPLAGAVICFTAVQLEKKTRLLNVAKEMGASERPDLTNEVTHLFVGATDSPKYQFVARERNDVKVLQPEWIEAVRESWMQGEDTDIQALEIKYKLPTFFGLTLCITGWSDMGYRTKMNDIAMENGAEFRRDLTKSVTHLVARYAEGEKYKFATQWGIKVVSEKWFYDCVERGMTLNEEKYHPSLPLDEQGVGAWDRLAPRGYGEKAKQRQASGDPSSDNRPRKKLRRTASTKLVGQNENIWGDIIGAGFMNAETTDSNKKEEDEMDSPPPRTVIQAAKSFASESVFGETMEKSQPQELAPKIPEGFLGGFYFYLHGFSTKQMGVLHRHLGFNGAECVKSLSEFSRPSIPKTGQGLYIMIPYQTPRSEVPSTDEMAFECDVVTDMWLEKCLHARALIPPESHVASTPFPIFPIPGFAEMRVCSTGFAGIDLLHVSKIVALMGATYDEVLTQQASVLICNDPQTASTDKLRHTSGWGVPAVSAEWLWISVQAGQKKPLEPYIVQKQISQAKRTVEKPGAAFANERTIDEKLKKGQEAGSKTSPDSTNEEVSEKAQSVKNNRNRVMPIIDDGFSKDAEDNAPQASVPGSRSPSPSKAEGDSTTDVAAPKQAEEDQAKPAGPSALDTALKGLLQQAQAAKIRQKSEGTTSTEDDKFSNRRKRKPLLGRAPSHSSTKALESTGAPSRASSVDTLNDDDSRIDVLNDQSLSSMFSGSGGKFDFLADKQPALDGKDEDEENTEPQMTQLDYEDADAAAMRAEFLRDAGKLVGKPKPADPALLIGEAREMEDVGWGSRRRTRKHPRGDDD